MTGQPPPVLPPAEAIAFFRRKGLRFGFAWQDVWQGEHGPSFTVAKAMTRDLLETIRAAVDRAIADGETLDAFRTALRPLLEQAGWWGRRTMLDPATGRHENVQLGSPRRLKTIFEVNMRTAYARGRWERIERSKRFFPFLKYVSVLDGRERPEHGAWHGTVLPVDHEWWDTHFPPCGWNCRCTVRPISRTMLAREGLTVTRRPARFPDRPWTNKRTGEVHAVEQGIDPGWAYHVGKAGDSGLAPPPSDGAPPAAMTALDLASPDLDGFFAPFGLDSVAARRRGRTFTDAGGWPLFVSAAMLSDAGGNPDRALIARATGAAARAIADPVSIRWLWVAGREGTAQLVRRYVGDDAVVDIGRFGWRFRSRGEPGFERLRAATGGTLVWSR